MRPLTRIVLSLGAFRLSAEYGEESSFRPLQLDKYAAAKRLALSARLQSLQLASQAETDSYPSLQLLSNIVITSKLTLDGSNLDFRMKISESQVRCIIAASFFS
jgi:5-enolpyruvylshikimate-3-phosphate synthase